MPQFSLRCRYSIAVSDYEEALGMAFLDAVDLYEDDADFAKIGPLLQQARHELELLTVLAVRRATGRETWQAIGDALGMTRQGAQQKFSRYC
jgi:hypothetical protein